MSQHHKIWQHNMCTIKEQKKHHCKLQLVSCGMYQMLDGNGMFFFS